MIGRLTGRLATKAPDQVLLDVGGVGYLVHIPLSTFYELPEAEKPGLALDPHARPRGRPRALRLPDRAGALALPPPAGRRGHRPESGPDRALRDPAVRARRGAAQAGRPATRGGPGRRQEDRRAHGARARREGRPPSRARPRERRPPPWRPTTSSPRSSTSATARPRPSAPWMRRARGAPERRRVLGSS